MTEKINRSAKEWRQQLTHEQYKVTRERETEPPFTGRYNEFKGRGHYHCVCCGNDLFSSESKYVSGTGWPSFYAPLSEESIIKVPDTSAGMIRTEVICQRCGAHLGHIFDDGPPPTGLRFCMNSVALKFVEDEPLSECNQGE